jgi:hypothetical protein
MTVFSLIYIYIPFSRLAQRNTTRIPFFRFSIRVWIRFIKLYKRQYLEWLLLYTFSTSKNTLSLNLLWAGSRELQPNFNMIVEVFCNALPHWDVVGNTRWIRLTLYRRSKPSLGQPGTKASAANIMRNCVSHGKIAEVIILTTGRYVHAKQLALVQSLPKI